MEFPKMVRKIDNLGRIVLPSELRKKLNVKSGDLVKIFIDENKIIFKKFQPNCIFCGKEKNTIKFKNKIVCENCLDNIT